MRKLFNERYKNLINDHDFITELPCQLKHKLVDHFYTFDEPISYKAGRYEDFWVNSSVEREALIEYFESKGWLTDDAIRIQGDKEWFFCRYTYEFFDIAEIWYNKLSEGEQIPFCKGFNELMERFDFPWRLFYGKVIKIDSQQFEQDLLNSTLSEMQELYGFVPEFKTAYLEFLDACDSISSGDYKLAILNACKSYESVLKVVLDVNKGNADVLTAQFIESKYMNALPADVKATGFREKVMMSLPFLRNNIAGHGDGKECYDVPSSVAKLAVNLAASMNTYIIEQFRANILPDNPESDGQVEDDIDDLPF